MIFEDMVDSVVYPDETGFTYWDRISYEEAIEFFQHGILITKGEVKKGFQESLAELERRWQERQEKQAAYKNIPANPKKSRKVVYPNGSI